jgi:hypothetical protein
MSAAVYLIGAAPSAPFTFTTVDYPRSTLTRLLGEYVLDSR